MITGIELTLIGPGLRADTNRPVTIRVRATFENADDVDAFTAYSIQNAGCTLDMLENGPYRGSRVTGVSWQAPGVGLVSDSYLYVRPGRDLGRETILVKSEDSPAVSATIELEIESVPEKSLVNLPTRHVGGSISSFFRYFDDIDILEAYWESIRRAASDLDARTSVAERSYRIFDIPVFSTRRWQGFDMSEANGGYDDQRVLVFPATDALHQFTPEETHNELHWNDDDTFEDMLATSPSGFELLANTLAGDATDRSELVSSEGTDFARSTAVAGDGVFTRQKFKVQQNRSLVRRLDINVMAKAWGVGGASAGAVAQVWNFEEDDWEDLGSTAAASSDPGAWSQIGGVIYTPNDEIEHYVDSENYLYVRVYADDAPEAGEEVHLSIDQANMDAGTIGTSAQVLESRFGTPIDPLESRIEVRSYADGSLYTEGVDYAIDYGGDAIVWLKPISIKLEVRVVFHSEYPHVYTIEEDVVSMGLLQREVVVGPPEQLKEGIDFVVWRRGQLRTKRTQHYPGQTVTWWAPTSLHDEQLVFKNFGFATQRLEDESSSVTYLRRIQALWTVFWSGPSIRNIEVGLQILMNAPFAFDASRVESIDGDVLRLENGQVAQKPPSTPWSVEVGQRVRKLQPLTAAAEVVDKVVDPGFMRTPLARTFTSEMSDDGVPQAVVDAVANEHFFTARVDGFSLAFAGIGSDFVETFLDTVRPIHTFMGMSVLFRADCGELVRGPCGLVTTGNCLCDIVGQFYDIPASVSHYEHLDVTELLDRDPYINNLAGAVDDVSDLSAIVNPDPGDTYFVRNENANYVWHEPQKLPQPTVDLGQYLDPGDDTFKDIVGGVIPPALTTGWPTESWEQADEEDVDADAHSAGQPPYDQWQQGGEWREVVGRNFDLPFRRNYKQSMDLNDSPDTGRSSEVYLGTALDDEAADIPADAGATYTDEAHTIGIPAGLGKVQLSNLNVTAVKRINNLSKGADVPKWEFDVDRLTGLITFDPHGQGADWDDGDSVEITYRTGPPVNERHSGEAGYALAKDYEDRAAREVPASYGDYWLQYDSAFDLGGDMIGPVTHRVRVRTDDGAWTTVVP